MKTDLFFALVLGALSICSGVALCTMVCDSFATAGGFDSWMSLNGDAAISRIFYWLFLLALVGVFNYISITWIGQEIKTLLNK